VTTTSVPDRCTTLSFQVEDALTAAAEGELVADAVATGRGAYAVYAHLREPEAARLRGHRPTALAAIPNPTTEGNCSGRRPPPSMPRPAGTARVSALACPTTSGPA
jgi:hypothetical protein